MDHQSAELIANAIRGSGGDQLTGWATVALAVATVLVAIVALVTSRKAVARADEGITRQTRATVISTSRVRWVDGIRDDLSEILSLREERKRFEGSETFEMPEMRNTRNRIDERMRFLRYRIEFRLSPEKVHHSNLLKSLDQYTGIQPDQTGAAQSLRSAAKTLFDAEWDRAREEAGGKVQKLQGFREMPRSGK